MSVVHAWKRRYLKLATNHHFCNLRYAERSNGPMALVDPLRVVHAKPLGQNGHVCVAILRFGRAAAVVHVTCDAAANA